MRQSLDYILSARDSVVGHWRFRETLSDESDNHHSLNLIGSSGFVEGHTENGKTGLHCDGTANAGCQILAADASDFDMGTDDFSLETIFRPTLTDSGFLIKKYNSLKGFSFGLYTNKIAFAIGNGTQTVSKLSATIVPNGFEKWYYVVITIERGNRIRMFIDGIEDAQSPFIETLAGSISNPSANLYIGQLFNGIVDEVSISKEVLTPAAIADRARGRFNPAPTFEPEFLRRYLPAIHQNNAELLSFLDAPTRQYLQLKDDAQELLTLFRWDECPQRYLGLLASLFDFELIEESYATAQERRSFFPWIGWIYKRKGRADAAQKIMELLGHSFIWSEVYPDWVPFLSNWHRTWDRSFVAASSFEDDFSSGNLSKWNPPLNQHVYWRVTSGKLRGTSDDTTLDTNAILFDNAESNFYMKTSFQIIDGFGSGAGLGMYLAWADENNYLRLMIRTNGSLNNRLTLERNIDGVKATQIIIDISDIVEHHIGLHTLWAYVDLSEKYLSCGIDDELLAYQFAWSQEIAAGTKKGLIVQHSLTVEFPDIKVETIDTRLVARTITEDFQKHVVKIKLTNHPQFDSSKRLYLQRVLPKYVPFFVMLCWAYEPETQARFRLKTGSFSASLGYILSGNRAARFRMKTGGITSVLGSMTMTPDPAVAKFRTQFVRPEYPLAGPAKMRFKVGAFSSQLIPLVDKGWKWLSFSDPGVEEPGLIDGIKNVEIIIMQTSDWNKGYGVSFESPIPISKITIYDGHYHANGWNDSQKTGPEIMYVYGNDTSPSLPWHEWTLQETFVQPTRANSKVILQLSTPITNKYIRIRTYSYGWVFQCPYGHDLYVTEIEVE